MEWTSFVGLRAIKLCWIGIIVILSIHLNAQEVIYSFPRPSFIREQFFISTKTDTLLVVLNDNRMGEVQELDIVSVVSKRKIHWVLPSGSDWIDIKTDSNGLSIFYSSFDEQNEMILIEVVKIEDMKWAPSEVVLSYPFSLPNSIPKFSLRCNEDFLVFLARFSSSKSKDILAFQCERKDDQWVLSHSAKWQIARHWNDWELERWEIDQQGNILLIPGENRRCEIGQSPVSPGKWELYYYLFDQRHLKEWDLLIGDKQLHEAYWAPLNDTMLVLGILCSSLSADPMEGWLQYTINSRKREVVKQQYQPFLYPKNAEGKWQGVAVQPSAHGGFVLIGEHYYHTEVRTTDFQTGRTYTHWIQHFDEIFFQSLNPDFSIEDSIVIVNKRQEVLEGEGCSFRNFERQGHWNLQYNDAVENDPFGDIQRTWNGRKGCIRQVSVDKRNKQISTKLVENEMLKKKGIWVPVNGGGGNWDVWWTINEILICRD